jgi:hypothetical protein
VDQFYKPNPPLHRNLPGYHPIALEETGLRIPILQDSAHLHKEEHDLDITALTSKTNIHLNVHRDNCK